MARPTFAHVCARLRTFAHASPGTLSSICPLDSYTNESLERELIFHSDASFQHQGALFSDDEKVNRKTRQLDASLGAFKVSSQADDESEELDERCYFPVTAVDMTLPDKYQEVRS